MNKEIPYKLISEDEYQTALDLPERKTNVIMVKLSKTEQTQYLYIKTDSSGILERTLLKTYLTDLYKKAWDVVEFTEYRKN